MKQTSVFVMVCVMGAALIGVTNVMGADGEQNLPDPSGEKANMNKPVQVFILMGQSNMVGAGHVKGNKDGTLEYAVQEKDKYPYLVDEEGNWTKRKDVRYVFTMGSGTGNPRIRNNAWMSIEGNGRIGPEFGIGYYLGSATDAPVMILKSCIGNRSLGWDLLPPGSERIEVKEKGKTMVYAGYKDAPLKWEKGTEKRKMGWYAGKQYDGDVRNAKQGLENLQKYYPEAEEYEIAGFFWWQGDKDRYNEVHASHYEENLVRLIKQLRKEFNAPDANFVCATLGQTAKDAKGNEGKIIDAMFAVDGEKGKYPEFKGNVGTVYTKPLSQGSASNAHYGGNAETYMDVGEAMGKEMIELLRK